MNILRHPAERGGSDQAGGWFERFSQAASNLTSSPWFYGFCVALVVAFIAVDATGANVVWDYALTGGMSAVTLLLLALLKNAESQTEHAIQIKLDAIGRVLLEQLHIDDPDTRTELEKALRHEKDV
jgi:low affinity Fe/Cu permease